MAAHQDPFDTAVSFCAISLTGKKKVGKTTTISVLQNTSKEFA